ncbi:regulatory protein RecX [Psychrobacter sp. I-STPA10]|uniref:regulatory protein RecX n=1 Tax=Psychrobacter sp. I-STPA10 TaxID=2585769 RepID=UPI001E58A0E1|nr:regulatory protein RecX [Psychrobacter sp. I-STPA10]
MQIKTLAEILAENSNPSSHSNDDDKKNNPHKNIQQPTNYHTSSPPINHHASKQKRPIQHSNKDAAKFDNHKSVKKKSTQQKSSKKQKKFHPATNYQPKTDIDTTYTAPDAPTIKSILTQARTENDTSTTTVTESSVSLHELPPALHAYLKTPEQRAAAIEQIKADSRLRWLAFYYLSCREHSAAELKQKLLDKEQDPAKIDALLIEFAEKGYQSEMRTALMLIREGIRKHRGRTRIKQEFYQRQVDIPCNIDELIDMANAESKTFTDMMATDDLVEGVDWLKLAVEARVKKYGEDIPSTPKDKARQLRFLQYRGFQADICFDAIKYNLSTLDERF